MNSMVAIGILVSLINAKRLTLKELAQKFEVSTKTISRYVLNLIYSGVPITCRAGRNGGIEISPDFVLQNNFFTTDEISSVSNLLNNCPVLKLSPALQSAFNKLELVSNKTETQPAEQVVVDNLPWGVNNINSAKTLALIKASQNSQKLEITYLKEETCEKRVVCPYVVVLKDGVFYLYAFCEDKDDFRLFRCSRVLSVKETGESFVKRQVDLTNKPWAALEGFNKIDLTLEVSKNVCPELEDWLNDIVIKKQIGDNLIVSATAIYNRGLINKIISYRGNLKVISPQCVREDVYEACKKTMLAFN